MNIIFEIRGGIGKSVAATAVVEGLAKKYPAPANKIIVVTGYPEVFVGNSKVYRSFSFNQTSYFYRDYIENQDFFIFAHDPYLHTSFVKQNQHLIKCWFDMFGLDYRGEQPKIYLTEREKDMYHKKLQSDKPIMIIQSNGGAENQGIKYSWARDIPAHIVVAAIDAFKNTHNILHIRREDQPAYNNTFHLSENFRGIAAYLEKAEVKLFMDSFAQHTAAAMGIKSTVLWIANKPKVFGYDLHDNIIANAATVEPELRASYLSKYDIGGNPIEFPYNNESEIFNTEDVLNSLFAQMPQEKKAPQLKAVKANPVKKK